VSWPATPLLALAVLTLAGLGCVDGSNPADLQSTRPVPVIIEVRPSWKAIGDPDREIAVFGMEFDRFSVIQWDGRILTTAAEDPSLSTLLAQIPADELQTQREVQITVRTRSGFGYVTSAPFPYPVRFARPIKREFQPKFFVPTAADTSVLVIGAGFVPQTEARLDDVPAAVDVIDYHHMRIRLPPGLLDEPKQIRVDLRTPGTDDSLVREAYLLPVFHPVEVDPAGGPVLGEGCLIDAHGVLQCWDPTPSPVAEHLRFRALWAYPGATRIYNTCAVSTGAELYCWGSNRSGQTGIGARGEETTSEPTTPVLGDHDFRTVAVGGYHACALDAEGRAWCWGGNRVGQLGTEEPLEQCPLGFTIDGVSFADCAMRPVAVAGDLVFMDIAAGVFHTCALTEDGAAFCWGTNRSGALGSGPEQEEARTPQPVATDIAFASITAVSDRTCALTPHGAAYCWGENYGDQSGPGDNIPVPMPVPGGLSFATLSLGDWHGCGLTLDGSGYCWGRNFYGQLGTGDVTNRTEPAPLDTDLLWTEIRPAGEETCGIAEHGGFYCWGAAYFFLALAEEPVLCHDYGGNRGGVRCHMHPTPVLGVAEP